MRMPDWRQLNSDLRRSWRAQPGLWLSRLVFLLGPWVCLWMVEILNENDIFEDLHAWQILMNLVWYYALFVFLRLILGRSRRAAALGAVLSFLVGTVNHYVLRFRGRILFPADISGWRTAANVADAFDYSLDVYLRHAIILLVAYLFLVFACVPQRKRASLPWQHALGLWLVIGGYCFAFFGTQMLPALGIYTQQWVTQRNGFLLNFTIALRYSSVDKPKGYSEKDVLELMERYPAVEYDPIGGQEPVNIIAIMNESVADFTVFEIFSADQDPTPFLHTMQENTVQGWMYSPVTGGGTASVEFEYLTGFSNLFQPPHTVAYQLYVEDGMPSLTKLANAGGYESTAFHPYDRSGWNRVLAYDYLGFDAQMYQEDVIGADDVRRYISDQSSYDMIFRTTARQDSSFFFNVTMQNHSGYTQGWNNLERAIQLPERLDEADRSAEQYMALARVSDQALEQLIAHYSQVEKPTMIVFFGDHQPPLKNAFYEELYGKPLSERTTEEVLQQYAVPFFIWTNYDIPEQRDVILSPNYLGVLTAKLAGLPMTGYMNFLDQMYEHLPVITPVGLIDEEGNVLKKDELDQEQQQWLDTYEILNYCGMVDLFAQARPMFCLDEE